MTQEQHIIAQILEYINGKIDVDAQDWRPHAESYGVGYFSAAARRYLEGAYREQNNQDGFYQNLTDAIVSLMITIMLIEESQEKHIFSAHNFKGIKKAVIAQLTVGKGTRHGGAETEFMNQSWFRLQRDFGLGFLLGQSAKKLEEAVTTKKGELITIELIGSLIYAAMAILAYEHKTYKAPKAHRGKHILN